ncbi:hypothetical protein GCM10027090_00340 [Sinomonas soli]
MKETEHKHAGKTNWTPEVGQVVEVRRRGTVRRSGSVDAVMPDGSGFWLAADGLNTRAFVFSQESDVEVSARS